MLLAVIIISIIILVIVIVAHKISHRLLIAIITLALLLGSQVLLLVNSYEHWGTNVETTKVTKSINSIASLPGNCQILAYKNVGKRQNQKQIYIYKASGKKQITYSDGVKIQIRRSNYKKAFRIKTISRYHYNNRFSQLMFAGIANNNQIKKRKVIFILPQNWSVMSSNNLVKVAHSIKHNQKSMKESIQQQMINYVKKHPNQANKSKALDREKKKLLNNYTQNIINHHYPKNIH